mmetsp:Transcript_81185/g.126597  ORF Transcript_81185/g.126597 Transcript_81185/m.126597 type:complete len:499 (+) Transcript_81185:70-1566(+)
MQLIMWPSLTAVAAVLAVLSSGAFAQPTQGQQMGMSKINAPTARPAEEQGTIDSTIEQQTQSAAACSCDCCQVQKLLPIDVQPVANGQTITSTCSKSVGNALVDGQVSAEGSDMCPEFCQIPNSNEVIFSNEGEVDYNRYCGYNCQPVSDAQGTACVQLSKNSYEEAQNSDGNGNELNLPPVLGIGSGYQTLPPSFVTGAVSSAGASWSTVTGGDAEGIGSGGGVGTGTAQGSQKPENAAEVVYDMRKLIAERLRSEAGAAVAQAASSAERVRINNFKAKQDVSNLEELSKDVTKMAGTVDQSTSGVEKQKAAAEESEIKAKQAIVEGSTLASQILKTTRRLADEAIKKEVTPYAVLAERSRAEAKGLDKPVGWENVVAARAANPYQVAVSAAVQRADEYKLLADSSMDKAFSAQKEANDLIPHANALEANGDPLGASIERKQATNLLARARQIAGDATVAQTIAENVRVTIPKWQNAAAQAATYAAWEYKNNAQAFR